MRTQALGVVVPVHNEEELLGHALDALGNAVAEVRDAKISTHVVMTFDTCRDASIRVAQAWAESRSRRRILTASYVVCEVRNVGVARRLGCATALEHFRHIDPSRIWIATTDADSRVPPSWLREQMRHHERGEDVWAGRVCVDEVPHEESVVRWQQMYDAEPHPIHGASLGFDAAKYLSVGGFPSVESGEDRALLRAFADSGANVYFDSSVRVLTSARRHGRAPHGFAETFHGVDSALGSIAD